MLERVMQRHINSHTRCQRGSLENESHQIQKKPLGLGALWRKQTLPTIQSSHRTANTRRASWPTAQGNWWRSKAWRARWDGCGVCIMLCEKNYNWTRLLQSTHDCTQCCKVSHIRSASNYVRIILSSRMSVHWTHMDSQSTKIVMFLLLEEKSRSWDKERLLLRFD